MRPIERRRRTRTSNAQLRSVTSDVQPSVARAQPRLGTIVSVRIGGLPAMLANSPLEAAFRAISDVQMLMSFHEPSSDVSRLNREAVTRAVPVDARTMYVIKRAVDFSRSSAGAFDITIAPLLVAQGHLPRPDSPYIPHPHASFEDIVFLTGNRIRFKRPLWIDLGGIAKGYAVDHAFERMGVANHAQVCINAGGDLRVAGPNYESVLLNVGAPANEAAPVVRLSDGSLATSTGRSAAQRPARGAGPHFHGVRKTTVGRRAAATVIATDCLEADALTKIVLACGQESAPILRRYRATAFTSDDRRGWRRIGADA